MRGREIGRNEGREIELFESIEMALNLKFGQAGLLLMSQIRTIHDLAKLRELNGAIVVATSLQEIEDRLR